MNKKRLFYASLALLLIAFFSFPYFQANAGPRPLFPGLPTEFVYPTDKIASAHSTQLISEARLEAWNEALEHYFQKHQVGFAARLRFYTYLFSAQQDAAYLSYNVHRCFFGSLDPLNARVVHAFFPGFQGAPIGVSDAYSELLATTVWKPYEARLAQEKSPILDWEPWITPLPHTPPPKETSEGQMKELEAIRGELTEKQKESARFWAKREFWVDCIQQYMRETGTSFAKQLLVRSTLMRVRYDTLIAITRDKVEYDMPRPGKVNPQMTLLIEEPDSPSYPSGHAAFGSAASDVLCFFFPNECTRWCELGYEVGASRLWAGVHFPQDVNAGRELGNQVAEQFITQLSSKL